MSYPVTVRRRAETSALDVVTAALLVTATIMTGLMAGFFYAYACSVMLGLARTDDRTFIATMQWINSTVRNVAFGPAFFGSLILTIAAAVAAVALRRSSSWWIIGAAALYSAAFLVTLTLNVPLNDQLAAAGPPNQIADLHAVRLAFEDPWNRWNLLRAVLTTAALAALSVALLQHSQTRSRVVGS